MAKPVPDSSDTIHYLGEIRIFAFATIPEGWAACDGALVNIQDAPELFFVLGTTYGGDGTTTFALPDLRGRLPLGACADSYPLGQAGGAAASTMPGVPAHSHALTVATGAGTSNSPAGRYLAASAEPSGASLYGKGLAAALAAETIGSGGTTDPDDFPIQQPALGLTFCIAMVAPPAAPYVGEVCMMAGNKCLPHYLPCDGRSFETETYPALSQVIAQHFPCPVDPDYFRTPALWGNVPMGTGTGTGVPGCVLGLSSGAASSPLSWKHIPAHSHMAWVSLIPGVAAGENARIAGAPASAGLQLFADDSTPGSLEALTHKTVGSSQPDVVSIPIVQPYLAVNFLISSYGNIPVPNQDSAGMNGYTGQIRIFSAPTLPQSWMACEGQKLAITDYPALYSIVGSLFAKATETHFFLPDFRGRVPIGFGETSFAGWVNVGASGGSATTGIDATTLPAHRHDFYALGAPATTAAPARTSTSLLAEAIGADGPQNAYTQGEGDSGVHLASNSILSMTGTPETVEVNTLQPYLALTFAICTDGIYPPSVPWPQP